jgi:hypothetical protein
MVLFKKIVEKNPVNKLKQGESAGCQVPLLSQRIFTYKQNKKYLNIRLLKLVSGTRNKALGTFGKRNKPAISLIRTKRIKTIHSGKAFIG